MLYGVLGTVLGGRFSRCLQLPDPEVVLHSIYPRK